MKVEVIYHYSEKDKECITDYLAIEMVIDGIIEKKYGDWYHDKGDAKVEGFIDGLKFALDEEIEVIKEKIPDGKLY